MITSDEMGASHIPLGVNGQQSRQDLSSEREGLEERMGGGVTNEGARPWRGKDEGSWKGRKDENGSIRRTRVCKVEVCAREGGRGEAAWV